MALDVPVCRVGGLAVACAVAFADQIIGRVPSAGSPETAGPGWREMLHCPQVWGTSVGMFSLGYVLYFLLSWLPSYLVSERGFSMGSMAVLGSIPFWVMAISSLFGGWTSDRWIRGGADPGRVRKSYAATGLLLCAAAMIPAPLVNSSGTSVALITAACMFLGLFTSNVWAITQTLAGPMASGRWTGVQNAIGNLGGVVSPLLTGWLVSETGSFSLAFSAATVVLVGGTVVYLMSLGNVRPVNWMCFLNKQVRRRHEDRIKRSSRHPSDLVSINSINPAYEDGRSEEEVARYVEQFFEKRGIETFRQEVMPGR